jgi:2-desacetyl-2-hydroxyethyl bacteriochlorophyllide A dehydrogenase
MKAVVFDQDNEFRLAEREVPEPGDGEVLLAVDACGICGSDLHAPLLRWIYRPPVVLGHEFAATVAGIGTGVEDLELGTPVVVNPAGLTCGRCPQCRAGFPNQCQVLNASGVIGMHRDGGMAEFVSVPRRILHSIPEALAGAVGAWTEPVAVATRAIHHGEVGLGASVAVFGAGAIGQVVLQVARAAGAGETLVVESSELRRRTASECGADLAIAPERLAEVDRRYDVVFDCTGNAAAFNPALELVDFGGRLVIVGPYNEPVQIDSHLAAFLAEVSIHWSFTFRDEQEFAIAIGLLERGEVDVEPLTSGVMPFERHEEAFASMRDPEGAVKILLAPAGSGK